MTSKIERIADRAIESLVEDGHELGDRLKERARAAAVALALTQLESLTGSDTTEAQKVAQARFDNLAAAGAQGVATALVSAVRSAFVEGIELLVTLSA